MTSAQRIPESLVESAAERLVSVPARQRRAAARQLVRTAPDFGIDLSLIWGTVDPDTQQVGQACLLVPAAGRTGMLYLSGPDERFPEDQAQHDARVACIAAAFDTVDHAYADRVRLIQALVSDHEPWAERACLASGMRSIGRLAYLRLMVPTSAEAPGPTPDGVRVRPVGDIDAPADRRALAAALERSYIDTLDCPGLCDLRDIDDVIDSHRATGAFDPALWWVVEQDHQPEGALLLARYPDQSVFELVYIGLSPALRGRGIGRILMGGAIAAASAAGVREMTCAVDTNNAGALHLYSVLGFRRFDARRALVRPTAGV